MRFNDDRYRELEPKPEGTSALLLLEQWKAPPKSDELSAESRQLDYKDGCKRALPRCSLDLHGALHMLSQI